MIQYKQSQNYPPLNIRAKKLGGGNRLLYPLTFLSMEETFYNKNQTRYNNFTDLTNSL